jgi:hypothetical protein
VTDMGTLAQSATVRISIHQCTVHGVSTYMVEGCPSGCAILDGQSLRGDSGTLGLGQSLLDHCSIAAEVGWKEGRTVKGRGRKSRDNLIQRC